MTTTTHRAWVYGDNVNTDVIFPGKYTYTVREPEQIARHALEDLDADFASNVQSGDVIVAGRNWGCGSSREQAVTALKYCGVRVIIAQAFSGLYFRNCINQGIHPILCPPDFNKSIKTGDTVLIDYAKGVISANGETFNIPPLSPTVRHILSAGGLVAMLKARSG
ncbi:MAG: 3-isopropylmalate dehydratase [Anaerolineaceae bacterium]|nr:MAG: 3-isopropylmalate dehydratase [Anaerolineaceae bacterium]